MSEEPTPKAPPIVRQTPEGGVRQGGRCLWCGYELKGLAEWGHCPECGTEYTPDTAARLKPRPSALVVCLRLSWPLLVMLLLLIPPMVVPGGDILAVFGIYAMAIAVPINCYFQVRFMLKKHLPEQTRTQGFILGLRALGTTVALLVLLITLVPLILLGACLVTGNWGL